MRTFLLFVALVALRATAAFPQEEDRFRESATVFAVELPVRVLADGKPVRGLRAQDFEVLDRGRPREILDVEVIDTAAVLPQGQLSANLTPALPDAVPGNYVFLFDFAYSGSASLSRALEAARALVSGRLPSGSRVAVAFFSALRGLRVLAPFSDDLQETAAAFDTIEALLARDPQAAEQRFAALASSASLAPPLRASMEDVVREAQILVRSDPYWPHRSVIRDFARGLVELPDLSSPSGRRATVFLLSHGFDSLYLTGRNSVGSLQQLERAFKRFRRAGWILHGINIGGLRAPNGRETLFLLAHETGGDSYENFNDLGEAFERLMVKTSVTYVLVFHVFDPTPDGAFRRLKVRLKNPPRGARVLHRPGYYAPQMPKEE